jgi:hypothetical protein
MKAMVRAVGPSTMIGLLVALCVVIALISIARTSGSDEQAMPERAGFPTLEAKQMTELHPKDGIPTLDAPGYEQVAAATWLHPREPVIAVEIGGVARAYPLRIMTWHEIVNDELGGEPISVTYCPLCNSAVAFRRPEIDGETATFGTSGALFRSNLLMYDRVSDSLWPQLTGIAARGEMAGARLLRIPSPIVSWESFREAFPDARVLSRETGFDRPYGENPYPGYDTDESPSFDVDLDVDERLPPMERVLGVRANDGVTAYPFSRLEARAGHDGLATIEDSLGGRPIVVIWKRGTVSVLDDDSIVDSRDVGTAVAYSSKVRGKAVHLVDRNGRLSDGGTNSTWNVFGRAVRGPLRGTQLEPVDTIEAFWFNWVAFHPNTDVWSGE